MRVPLLSAALYILTCIPIVFASELHSGDSVQNSLLPGATQSYSLNLQSGDLVSLDFIDTGQDVILTVLNSDGQTARRFSSKLQGGEPLTFYAAQSGAWQIILSGRAKDSECGYKISGLKITKSETLLKSPDEVQSPRLKQLTNAAAVERFWSQIEKEGAPLIEPLADDPRNMLVTIVWRARAETKGVMVQSQFCDGESCFMKHLVNTDLWYASFKINRRVRTYYSLVPNLSSAPEHYDLIGAPCHNEIR
jgi:hypothetical protein